MFLETGSFEHQGSKSIFQKSEIPKLKVTDRDLSILEFLLEMKFAGFEEIYEKFFPQAVNLFFGYSHWSRDRMAKLRSHGLVRTFQFPESQRRYFLATDKGRSLLLRERPFLSPPWALKKPQFIHFEHDLMVLKVRLLLEKRNRVSKWISERFLKIEFGDTRDISFEKHNIPDGIFQEPNGKKVALEVEMGQKSLKKYQEKIRFLTTLLRSQRFQHFEFNEVYFLCKSKAVANKLKQETKIYGDLFKIETLEEFFKNQSQQTGINNG